MKTPPEIAIEIFRAIPDPRMERTKVHNLEIIMFIALCTYLSGGEGFYDMEAYAEARKTLAPRYCWYAGCAESRYFQSAIPGYFSKLFWRMLA